ncbi:hypothetical protein DFS34DRAFT_488659 [Phlyctochytrium arcticum]|nr:hypothetical protein DFS34DRAFT_488659 [Phlyctochytrium arcticum]
MRSFPASLVVLLGVLLSLVRADLPVPQGLPDPGSLKHSQVIYPNRTDGYQHAFYWQVENEDTADETLHGILELTAAPGKPMSWSWIGIGFGKSMLDAQFIVCHQLKGAAIEMHEHTSAGSYRAPYHFHGGQVATPVQGAFINNRLVCEFTRKTRPNDNGVHSDIDVNNAPILWAFSPVNSLRQDGTWFSYHTEQHRGAASANFATGGIVAVEAKSFVRKQIHGFGMMAVWLFIFPFAIYWARYRRSTYGWLFVHLTLQILGTLAILVFFVVILTDWIQISRPHAILGLFLISFVVIQLVLGIFNLLGLSNEAVSRVRKTIRLIHNNFGIALVAAATAQIALGLETLYPWYEPRGRAAWVVYFALVGLWLVAFLSTELFFLRTVRTSSKMVRKHKAMMAVGNGKHRTTDRKHTRAAASDSTVIPLGDQRLLPQMKRYTWETLAQSVLNGELLVVANGRYVYSIEQWMSSHPGGQLILHAVNGTDITNDYFNEAGFDAEEFVPKPDAPAQRGDRANAVTLARPAASFISQSTSVSMYGGGHNSLIEDIKVAPLMLERDWKLVVRSRRTHIHTRLAIQKLSKMLVGELIPDLDRIARNSTEASDMTMNSQDVRPFDPNEYRRYALVESKPISSASQIYRFRFCLLYPYDVRNNEPESFLPGQAIEIQARINGQLVTRFYSPQTDGNLSVFEIDVKLTPHGEMSPYLIKQKPGDRQFKVRGPFGTPLVHPGRPLHLSSSDWVPRNMIFVAGGTGLTPFLQLVKYLFLPVLEPLKVVVDYHKTLDDELGSLVRGDRVLVKHHYYDGWGIGVNLRTGDEGAFPLSITAPRCGPRVRITLVHAVQTAAEAALGNEFIEGAMLAYPDSISVHRFIADGTLPHEGETTGIVYPARLNSADLDSILRQRWLASSDDVDDHIHEHHTGILDVKDQRLVVCGPTGFNSWVTDVVSEAGVDMRSVNILPSDRVV